MPAPLLTLMEQKNTHRSESAGMTVPAVRRIWQDWLLPSEPMPGPAMKLRSTPICSSAAVQTFLLPEAALSHWKAIIRGMENSPIM